MESDRLKACTDYFNDNSDHLDGLIVNSSFGYHLDNIDFLKNLRKVRGFILVDELQNTEGLSSIKEVEYLQLERIKTGFDFSEFRCLKVFRGQWDKKCINIASAHKLEALALWGYKAPNGDLAELGKIQQLKKLELTSSSIDSLNGLEQFSRIENLSFHYMPKLRDISALGRMRSILRAIHFENCKNIATYNPLAQCKSIESIQIERSAMIENLSFIEELKELRKLSFVGTKLINLDPKYFLANKLIKIVIGTKGNKIYSTE